MSITVRLIFLGLVGFVPSPEGREHMAALLVDPVRAQPYGTACPVAEHVPFVFLLHGSCESGEDCIRIAESEKGTAERIGLFNALAQKGDSRPLAWLLKEEDLEISGDEDEELELRRALLSFLLPNTAPGSSRQTSYFSWVPSMDKLTRGHGQLRNDCLAASRRCPLHARFRVDGGEVGACHLFHDPADPANSSGAKRDVRIFGYLTPDQRHFRRAVADAVLESFKEDRGYVILSSRGLPERPESKVSVRLIPDEQNRLTLVIANLPFPHAADLQRHDDYLRPHSDVFFHLLADPVMSPPVRLLDRRIKRVEPGECEEDMEELATLFSGLAAEYPHAPTACDGISFPKPK